MPPRTWGSFRTFLFKVIDLLLAPVTSRLAALQEQLLAAHLAVLAQGDRYADQRCLVRAGYRGASQNEEDGIIDEIFTRIGTTNRYFVEFGVGDGRENNTCALLLAGWSGLWIEANTASARFIRSHFADPIAAGQLRFLESFVTAEEIEKLFEAGAVPAEPDLLSIDIDGNDYWVWRAVARYRPRVVVIEYNAQLGRSARLVQPYDARACWDETMAYGASLGALDDLGREKGYSLVGCGIGGVNAFFVRADCLGDRFLEPFTAARHYEPRRISPFPVRWARFERR
jgi:hypothetical protein